MTFHLTPNNNTDHQRARAREIFLPSRPITDRAALRGRERQLDRVLETLETPGRSVFVFGERGIGKTSLAQTAAYLFNTSEFDPILLACHRRSTFGEIISQIVRALLAATGTTTQRTTTTEHKVGISTVFSFLKRIEEKPDERLSRLDPNLAVDLFNAACPERLTGKVVVLLDELDVVEDESTRGDIAYLIKQAGDRVCNVKLMFAGIGETVESLLKHHESASRYMATIRLERLSLTGLREIVTDGFGQLGIRIDDHFSWRAASISDGFAHFTHLLSLKLALLCIDEGTDRVTPELFARAIDAAIEDSEAWLKQAYETAVQKYQDVYEHVLWAAADHWELMRSTDQIYQSYCRICTDLKIEPEKKSPAFYNRLNSLRDKRHGPALVTPRRSWNQFRQTMLRGYCRLVAASKDVEVGVNYGERSAG